MHTSIEEYKEILKSKEATVGDKFAALFNKHGWSTQEGLAALREAYPYLGKSEFLEHEVVFVLGQHVSESSLDFLLSILNSPTEAPIVRHEAAEAVGNFYNFKERVLPELQKYLDSDIRLLRLTIPVAIRKLESLSRMKDSHSSDILEAAEIDDSFTEEELDLYLKSIGKMEADVLRVLLSDDVDEYIKYRIVYTLCKREDKASVVILSRLILRVNQAKTTPLIRHEIGYILGDMREKADYDEVREAMRECIESPDEEPIVKHEVIIGYIKIWGTDALIENQKQHPCLLISESAQAVRP